MLAKRLISAFFAALILVAVLLCPYKVAVNVGAVFVSLLALFEIYKSYGFLKHKTLCALGFICAIMFSFYSYVSSEMVMVFILFFILAISLTFFVFRKSITINEISVMFFLTVYVCFLCSRIVAVRYVPFGEIYIWLIFIGAYMSDSGAFFVGTYLGKHKMCPDISPKKTWEGAVGGVLTSGIVFALFGVIYMYITKHTVNLPVLIILGLLSAVFAQLGDLFASVIKREWGIKDFGSIMPGHGGMLDRIDSVLFVAPLVQCFITYFEIIK